MLKHTRGVLPSISDITQQAGLSRSTFYHHYETVMDVVVDIHRDLMRDLDDRCKTVKRSASSRETVHNLLNAITICLFENKSTIETLVYLIPQDIFCDIEQEILSVYHDRFGTHITWGDTEAEESSKDMAINMLVYGITAEYVRYFQRLENTSLSEIQKAAELMMFEFIKD